MVPNGAVLAGDARQRAIQMAKMKRMGFKNGVSDCFLAVPKGGFAGLWIEMKRRQLGVVREGQSIFLIVWPMSAMTW